MEYINRYWAKVQSEYHNLSRIEKSTEMVGDYYLNPLTIVISITKGTIYLGANDMRYMDIDEMEELKLLIQECIDKSIENNYNYEAINKGIQDEKEAYDLKIKEQLNNRLEIKTYVYLAFDNHSGYWKIGYSKNPQSREKSLKLSNPLIEMKYYFIGNRSLETSLHSHYKDKKVHGEWFSLTEKDITDILNDTWHG